MIESILGTIFLCIIIISLALSFIQYIGIKVDTKTYEPEITYIGDYDIVNIGLHFILKNVRPYAAPCSEA